MTDTNDFEHISEAALPDDKCPDCGYVSNDELDHQAKIAAILGSRCVPLARRPPPPKRPRLRVCECGALVSGVRTSPCAKCGSLKGEIVETAWWTLQARADKAEAENERLRADKAEAENERLRAIAENERLRAELRRRDGWWRCDGCGAECDPDTPNGGDECDLLSGFAVGVCPSCVEQAAKETNER